MFLSKNSVQFNISGPELRNISRHAFLKWRRNQFPKKGGKNVKTQHVIVFIILCFSLCLLHLSENEQNIASIANSVYVRHRAIGHADTMWSHELLGNGVILRTTG